MMPPDSENVSAHYVSTGECDDLDLIEDLLNTNPWRTRP